MDHFVSTIFLLIGGSGRMLLGILQPLKQSRGDPFSFSSTVSE